MHIHIIHIYIYVHVHIIYIYIYTCKYIYIYTSTYMYIHLHTNVKRGNALRFAVEINRADLKVANLSGLPSNGHSMEQDLLINPQNVSAECSSERHVKPETSTRNPLQAKSHPHELPSFQARSTGFSKSSWRPRDHQTSKLVGQN